MWQVGGFHRFQPPIELLKVGLNTIIPNPPGIKIIGISKNIMFQITQHKNKQDQNVLLKLSEHVSVKR
jgi:hypothetical protein